MARGVLVIFDVPDPGAALAISGVLQLCRRGRRQRATGVAHLAFDFSPNSTSRRMASERPTSFAVAHASTPAIKARGILAAIWGSRPPFGGLPRLFGTTFIGFPIIIVVP